MAVDAHRVAHLIIKNVEKKWADAQFRETPGSTSIHNFIFMYLYN